MTNTPLPESFIIQQLLEALESIEQRASQALDESSHMTENGSDELAYVRASGYSKGVLTIIKTTAQVYREHYTNV